MAALAKNMSIHAAPVKLSSIIVHIMHKLSVPVVLSRQWSQQQRMAPASSRIMHVLLHVRKIQFLAG